jgi:large subunit ribosomal protein L6
MSRVGKQAITIPEGVTVTLVKGVFTAKGPLGTLTREFKPEIEITVEGNNISLKPKMLNVDTRALWGTYAAHIVNMLEGVKNGFTRKLVIEGIGYKANLTGDKLVFNLGLSHQVEIPIPAGLKVLVDKNVAITISGADKELVGQFTSNLRMLKPPEPYKGKGIRYEDEVVRRKEGKKATATA